MKMEMEIVKSNEKLISPNDTISQTQTQTCYSYKGGSTWGWRLFVTIHVDNRNQLYDCVLHNLLGLSSCSTSCWYNGAWALAQSLSINKNNVTYCDRESEREREKDRPDRPMSIIMQVRSVNAPGELHFPFLLSALRLWSSFIFASSVFRAVFPLLSSALDCMWLRCEYDGAAPAYRQWTLIRAADSASIAVITLAAIIMAGRQSRCNGFYSSRWIDRSASFTKKLTVFTLRGKRRVMNVISILE